MILFSKHWLWQILVQGTPLSLIHLHTFYDETSFKISKRKFFSEYWSAWIKNLHNIEIQRKNYKRNFDSVNCLNWRHFLRSQKEAIEKHKSFGNDQHRYSYSGVNGQKLVKGRRIHMNKVTTAQKFTETSWTNTHRNSRFADDTEEFLQCFGFLNWNHWST